MKFKLCKRLLKSIDFKVWIVWLKISWDFDWQIKVRRVSARFWEGAHRKERSEDTVDEKAEECHLGPGFAVSMQVCSLHAFVEYGKIGLWETGDKISWSGCILDFTGPKLHILLNYKILHVKNITNKQKLKVFSDNLFFFCSTCRSIESSKFFSSFKKIFLFLVNSTWFLTKK